MITFPPLVWISFLVFVVMTSTTPAHAQGTARSLDIQPGGRQNGMGAAGVALFGDPSDALWWNPAALGFADRTSFQYTYANLLPELADIPYHHAAAAAPLGAWGGFGTSFTYLNYRDFTGADESSPSFALGIRMHPMVSIGAKLKWVDLGYGLLGGQTFSSDIGALVRVERNPWTFGFGAMYQNLGGKVDFGDAGTSPLSRNYKIGASAAVPIHLTKEWTAGSVAVVDYNQSDVTDDFHTWNGGVEAHLTYGDDLRLAMRGGYYYDPDGNIKDFTYGAGIRLWMATFDAGWIPEARDSGLDRVVKITAGVHVDLSANRVRWPMD